MFNKTTGSIIVIGGGVAGIQASLDLANSGYLVYLIEKGPAIGGTMSQLDKTFPTNDCSMCIISPKLVEAGRHLNIKIITMTEISSISGKEGNFDIELIKKPRFVDMDKCIACGICAEKCPKKVIDLYNQGLSKRKAIYLQYPQAVPLSFSIDEKNCIFFKNGKCRACEKFCPASAINFEEKMEKITIKAGAIILAPGLKPFDPTKLEHYGYSSHPNIITSLEFERILSVSGPYQGHLVKPSDQTPPRRIAWIQCAGSRDLGEGKNYYCSSVCCMYANKQAVIAKEHSENPIDTTVFFMDMRTFGKDFDKYTLASRNERGVRHIRSRIHSIFPTSKNSLKIIYATEQGNTVEEKFDIVVLSIGMSPDDTNINLANILDIKLNDDSYVENSNFSPISTKRKGIYVCGTFQEPKDIPHSVMEASASSASAAELLSDSRWTMTENKILPPEIDYSVEKTRIGVFVCNCGINIGGVADVPAIRDHAQKLPNVIYAEDNLFSCSQDSQDHMKKIILEKKINRVVVASCSPRTHEAIFQGTIREAGLNKYLFEMANIRDQNTWIHSDNPYKATQKAKDLVRMAVAKVGKTEALNETSLKVEKSALIVGGGIAGMEAALSLSQQGCRVFLVEEANKLGGMANSIHRSWQGESVASYIEKIIKKIEDQPKITLYTRTTVKKSSGTVGNFVTKLIDQTKKEFYVNHGVTIIAVGAQEYKPNEYFYGSNSNVLTHLDLDFSFAEKDPRLYNAKNIAFIQCVGSRNLERPYCSKVCCTHSLKSAIALKKLDATKKILILYRDIRSYGFREKLYHEARKKGILFIRYDLENLPKVSKYGDGKIYLSVKDHVLSAKINLKLDILVLASGIIPNKNRDLTTIFNLPLNNDGFFVEAHAKLRPVDFASDGVFLAGLAHYPKPIEESIAQAKAAASRAMTILSKKEIVVSGIVATIDDGKCAACLTCVRTCSYQIPSVNEHSYAVIDKARCHGCGTCVSECPGKAISLKHFTDSQLVAKAEALFQ